MKKLLLLLTMFTSVATFANFRTTTPLFGVQNPVKAPRLTDPTIEDFWAEKIGSTGNLAIDVRSSGSPQAWKATIGVRTYRLIGIHWQWVTMLYDIVVPPNEWVGGDQFVIGSNWQYQGHDGACCGDYWINSDQLTIVSWQPN